MPGASGTTHADSPPAVNEPSPREASAGRPEVKRPADKVRIRFAKSGALRLLSHHDLMRTFERLLRRAELPFFSSQGFHPKPRLVFALSLPLGVVGRAEVVELELGQALPTEAVQARLARQAPPGLEILSVRRIDPKVNAQVCRLAYAVRVPAERLPELSRRIAELLSAGECWIGRHRPHSRQAPRRLDVRPFLADIKLRTGGENVSIRAGSVSDGDGSVAYAAGSDGIGPLVPMQKAFSILEMLLHLTPSGTARPEEVLGLLGLQDLLDAGAVLERTRLEIQDEE